jgi:hypothetical protein
MLAGLPVPVDAVEELAGLVRAAGADDLADRLDRAVADEVKLSRSRSTSAPSCSRRSRIRVRVEVAVIGPGTLDLEKISYQVMILAEV